MTLNNLAALHDAQDLFDKAEPLLQRAFEIRKKALGPKHPDVVTTQRDLLALYMSTERYALAEEYLPPGEAVPNEGQKRRLSIPLPSPKGFDPTVRPK